VMMVVVMVYGDDGKLTTAAYIRLDTYTLHAVS